MILEFDTKLLIKELNCLMAKEFDFYEVLNLLSIKMQCLVADRNGKVSVEQEVQEYLLEKETIGKF